MSYDECSTRRAVFTQAFRSLPDPWGILILAEALTGTTHFTDFQRVLGVVPTTLTRRLNDLVATGLMERRPYSKHPRREEYVLTTSGLAFADIADEMLAWSARYGLRETEQLEVP